MSAASNPRHILIVDDDVVMTELLQAVFCMHAYDVEIVHSGEEALSKLSGSPATAAFAVVLTDLQLPGLQGADLAAALRGAMPEDAVLIGMSGSHANEAALAAYDAFLLKPFTVDDFVAAVQSARAGRGARRNADRDRAAAGIAPGDTLATLDEAIFARLAKQLPPSKLQQLYELTLDDIAKRLARMQASESAGDEDADRREAHAIKGGCGMVGALELHRLAASREGGSAAYTPPLVDFHAACERLRRILVARF